MSGPATRTKPAESASGGTYFYDFTAYLAIFMRDCTVRFLKDGTAEIERRVDGRTDTAKFGSDNKPVIIRSTAWPPNSFFFCEDKKFCATATKPDPMDRAFFLTEFMDINEPKMGWEIVASVQRFSSEVAWMRTWERVREFLGQKLPEKL